MKRFTAAALLAVSFLSPAMAADGTALIRPSRPAQLTLPPNFAPQRDAEPKQQPVACDLKASPDHVPGVDARGREVVPADVSTAQPIEIDSEMFVEVRTRNPQVRGVGVIVNLPNLGAPACVPTDETSRQ